MLSVAAQLLSLRLVAVSTAHRETFTSANGMASFYIQLCITIIKSECIESNMTRLLQASILVDNSTVVYSLKQVPVLCYKNYMLIFPWRKFQLDF
jgi:hypothetical protein